MRRDPGELLEGAAEQPSTGLDAAALVDMAIARRRRRVVATGVAVLALAAVALAVPTLWSRPAKVDLVQRPPQASEPGEPPVGSPPPVFRPRVTTTVAASDSRVWIWGGYNGSRFFADGFEVDAGRGASTAVPRPPLSPRAGAAAVWARAELIVVGGERGGFERLRDGAAYDPEARQWRSITDVPPTVHRAAPAVFVGGRMTLWGGMGDESEGGVFAEGAAYDPTTDEWSDLPPAPIQPRTGHTVTASGDSMIVWGGGDDDASQTYADGAVYRPATNSWTPVDEAPIAGRGGHSAVWTGEELIVWGGRAGADGTELADGAAYDPRTRQWRRIADAPLKPRSGHGAAWTGTGMVVWGGTAGTGEEESVHGDGAVYDPAADTWSLLPPAPLEARMYPAVAAAGGSVLVAAGTDADEVRYFGDAALWSADTGEWTPVARGERQPVDRPRPDEKSQRAEQCFDPPAAGEDTVRRRGRADVDGDGRDDVVSIVGRIAGQRDCAYSVVVKTKTATYRQRLASPPLDPWVAQQYMGIEGFYELNGASGHEFLVDVIRGATGSAYVGFTMADGDLAMFTKTTGDLVLFGAFSSAGYGSATDCVDGRIVESGYDAVTNRRYRVTRDFFTVDGRVLEPAGSETHRVEMTSGLQQFPEFGAQSPALPHCPQSGD